MLSSPINSYIPDVIVSISTPKEMHFLLTKYKIYVIIFIYRKELFMEKYVPVKWFEDTNCRLLRHTPSYSEEFSILNAEVPAIDAVPADELRKILDMLKRSGGYEELVG